MSRELWIAFFVSLAAHASLVGICDPFHVRNAGEKGDEKDIVLLGIVQLAAPAVPEVLPDPPPARVLEEPIPEEPVTTAPAVEPLPPPVGDELALFTAQAERAPAEPPMQPEELPAEVPMVGQDSDAGRRQLTEGQIEDLRSRYLRKVLERLEAAKRYPRLAYRRGLEGTVEIEFTISGDGNAAAAEIRQSSGHRSLDAAAAEMVSRATPFHPIPTELETDSLDLTVPVAFKIE